MSHLGQRLSALIDGELDSSERERVLIHMARCGSCRDEVAALRMLKRRMNALGEAAAGAGLTGLTGRLMDLSESILADRMPMGEAAWPQAAPASPWPVPSQGSRPEQRVGKYFLAGSLIVFLAGLGTAAFIAGGEPQAQAPSSPATPSVDVLVVPQQLMNAHGSRFGQRERPQPAPSTTSSGLP
jgi:anti-sigma factor RsiW